MESSVKTVFLENQSVELELNFFKNDDIMVLTQIYQKWVALSDLIKENGGRRINIPELLSEAIFCYHYGAGKMVSNKKSSKIKSSFDCIILSPTVKRIQIKACSVSEDLTSFGPKSVWDEIYLVHFFPNQIFDGAYKIYKIENDLIYNHKVNADESFREQQTSGKRPRFSILKELVQKHNVQPEVEDRLPIRS